MSTEMKHIDPFSMPNDKYHPASEEQIPLFANYDFDLHDNYDLTSQPCGPPWPTPILDSRGVRNEGR